MRSRRLTAVSAALAAAALAAGCTSGDYRRISLTHDMSPGDAAHFRQAAAGGSNLVEDFRLGLPFSPVICKSRETTIDRGDEGRTYVHVEDDAGLLLYLLASSSTVSNFDTDGRNLDWSTNSNLLLGLIGTSSGERTTDHGRTEQSGFRLLWGVLLKTSSDDGRASWRVLMIPF